MINFTHPHRNNDSTPFIYSLAQLEFNCTGSRVRTLSVTTYDDTNVVVLAIDKPSIYSPITSGTYGGHLLRAVCFNAFLYTPVYDSVAAARNFASSAFKSNAPPR